MLPEWARDIAAGTAAGFASKPLEYPLDTIKVRLQADSAGRYRSTLHCLTVSLRESGVKGIYRGLASPLTGAMVENAVLFAAYGFGQRLMRDFNHNGDPHARLSIPELAFAGSVAGLAGAHLLSPVERIKCIVQFQEDRARTERLLADSDYLAREIAALRQALGDVATRDYVRSELRDQVDDIITALDRHATEQRKVQRKSLRRVERSVERLSELGHDDPV